MLQQRPAGLFSDTRHAEGAGGGGGADSAPDSPPSPTLRTIGRRKTEKTAFGNFQQGPPFEYLTVAK